MNNKRPRRIFFGWWMVIVNSVISGFALAFTNQGASVLFKPISTDLGIDRAAASMANSIGTILIALAFAIAAWLLTRFGPKWIVFCGACMLGVSCIAMRFIGSPAAYYAVWGLIVGACTLGFSVTIDNMITNWFVRKRGLAFSVKWGITSVMAIVMLPALSWLVENYGWQTAAVLWGTVILLSTILLLCFVRQKDPEYYGMMPDGAESADAGENETSMRELSREYAEGVREIEFEFRQALKTPAYWMLGVGWVIWMAVQTSFNLHTVPFLTDMGISPVAAASMLAMMVFFTLPSRVLGSAVADHVQKKNLKFLLAGSLFLMAAGITAFLLMPSMVGIWVLLVLYGLGFGAYNPLDTLTRARYFGRKAYGSLQGISMLLTIPLTFLGPIYVGWTYDTLGTYIPAFTVFALVCAAGGVVLCLVRIPKVK